MAFPVIATTNTTNGTTATTSAVVNMPASIAAGDLLLVLHRSAVGTAAHSDGGGTWTNLFNDNSDASDDRISLWYKVAAGGDSLTITQTSSKFASIAWRITGAANPATQAPQFATLVTGSSTTPDPGSLTPTGGAKDYLWLWMGGWEGEQTSPPAGNPTDYADSILGANSGTGGAITTNCRVASAARSFNAVSQDPGSWTISVTDDWTATVVAIHPAPPAVPLDAAISTTGIVAGSLSGINKSLAATVTPTADFAGALNALLKQFAADVSTTGLVVADLTVIVGGAVALDAAIQAVGDVSAALSATFTISSSIQATGILDADLNDLLKSMAATVDTTGKVDAVLSGGVPVGIGATTRLMRLGVR